MKTIDKEIVTDFFSKHEMAFEATQLKLCIPIVNRIYRKMKSGIRFAGIKVDGELLCDGHHRYIASLLADYEIEKYPAIATSATIKIAWQDVVLEEEDWDTEAKIKMLNEQDALYNGIPIEKLDDLVR